MSQTSPEIVIPPTGTPLLGVMAALGSLASLLVTAMLVSDPKLVEGERIMAGAMGLLWGIAALLVAVRLFTPRNGLVVDRAGQRLGFVVTGRRDTWWLPLARVAAVQSQAVAMPGAMTIERWICQARLQNGLVIVIVESASRDFIEQVASGLRERLGLVEASGSDTPPLVAASTTFAVQRGGALQAIVTTFGAATLLTGVLAFTRLGDAPIVGFIAGPILAAIGAVLLATAIIKRLATETLAFDGLHWHHAFRIGRYTWAQRSIRSTHPLWRIQMLGARGCHLELKGEDGTLVMGAASTARSRLDLDALATLPERFHSQGP